MMSREMKDSGIEWIGEIPKGWEIMRFKYSGSFVKGKLPDETNLEGFGMPIIGATEMNKRIYKTYTLDENVPTCASTDVLILWDGANAGLIANNLEGVVSSTVVKYTCQNENFINQFVFYLLKCSEKYFREKVNGTTIPHMNSKYIDDIPMLLPTLSEQQKIANHLDTKCIEIDNLISLQEEMIAELKAYKQSVITEAVCKGLDKNAPMKDSGVEWIGEIPEKWSISKIKNEFEILDYLREPISAENRKNELGLYDYYGASGVIDKIDDYNVDDKVLLIGEDGANLVMRNLPLIYRAEGKFWVNNHAHILKPIIKNEYDYMAYLLEAGDYILYITGSAQPKLSQDKLKNFIIPIPDNLTEQQTIANYLDKKCANIDQLISIKQQKADELKEYKKSMIYEYVTGKKEVI